MRLPIQDKIDDGIFSAIGLVMVLTSQVHAAMAAHLMRLMHTTDDKLRQNVMIVTYGMKIDTLLGLMKSLVRVNHETIADDFDKAADALRDSFTNKRDVLAHQATGINSKRGRISVARVKTVGKFDFSEYDLTETQIRIWANEIYAQSQKIDQLLSAGGIPAYGTPERSD
jgi:hypothetical protein